LAVDAENSVFVQYRDAWRVWSDFLEQAPSWLRLVLRNPNPEIALSLPDLFDLAVLIQDEHTVSSAVRRLRDESEDTHEDVERYFEGDERAALRVAWAARSRLTDALHWYFMFRHDRDRAAARDSRAYLRRHLNQVGPGDAVLTTNWDPLVERTLAEDGRWSPHDGYGFDCDIVQLVGDERRQVPEECLRPSTVKVLKLHGCFGWRDLHGAFFLEGADYLDVFGFSCNSQFIRLRDKNQPEFYSPSDPVIAFPSFLKSLSHQTLAEVWRQASLLAVDCTEFVAAGYSLPASDVAIRALLLPIANGVRRGTVVATIVDSAKSSLERWQEFLGSKAQVLHQSLETTPELFMT
jgi:hypothetical protein